jgi:hypothetical protein
MVRTNRQRHVAVCQPQFPFEPDRCDIGTDTRIEIIGFRGAEGEFAGCSHGGNRAATVIRTLGKPEIAIPVTVHIERSMLEPRFGHDDRRDRLAYVRG